MKKQFFLFTARGITDRFFCGNVYESFASDEIKVDGEPITFAFAVEIGRCKVFDSRKEANDYSRSEEDAMIQSDRYASEAMACEDRYGVEGVDDCSGDY